MQDWICTGCTREGDAYAVRADEKTLRIRTSSGFSAEIDPFIAYRMCRRRTGVEFARDARSAMQFIKRMFESDEFTITESGQLAFKTVRIAGEPFPAPDAWLRDVFVEKARRERADRDAKAAAVKREEKKPSTTPMSPDSTSSIGRWILRDKRDRPRLARSV